MSVPLEPEFLAPEDPVPGTEVEEPEVTEVEGPEVTEVEDPEPEPEPVDPFADFGGRDAVEQAARLYKNVQTQDGIMRLFFEAGRALQIPLDRIEGVFGAQAAAAVAAQEAEPEPADDDMITWGQVKQLLQREVIQPFQQTEAQRTETAARSAVASARDELGIKDEKTWQAVLRMGDQYLGNDMSPENVRNAVRRGHADFVEALKSSQAHYKAQKVATKAAVPKAPSGGVVAPAEAEEPKDLDEAFKRARARMAEILGD